MNKKQIFFGTLVFLFIICFSATSVSASKKYIGSKNNVYGKLTNKTKKQTGGLRKDKTLTYVSYGVDPDKTIDVVKEDFRDLPLDTNLDKESLDEHITDFMEKDAVQTSTTNDGDLIYSSSKIGKSYLVKLTKNTNGEITWIRIFRGDRNDIN